MTIAHIKHIAHYNRLKKIDQKKYRHIPGPPADGIFGFFFGNILEIKSNNNKLLLNKVAEWLEIKHSNYYSKI